MLHTVRFIDVTVASEDYGRLRFLLFNFYATSTGIHFIAIAGIKSISFYKLLISISLDLVLLSKFIEF